MECKANLTDVQPASATDAPFTSTICSVEELRRLYRQPSKLVAEKKLDHLPPWATAMIGASRFVFIATAGGDGRTTVSPKGGAAGFVTVVDDRRLAIPDYPGNNLLDSLQHIVANPSIGIIFVMPGRPETLRVDGDAWVSTDPDLLARCTDDDRRPKSVIAVRVREAFFHCPASFQRSELWDPGSWNADDTFVEFIRATLPRDDWPEWAATE